MRQRDHRLAIVVSAVTWLLAIAGGEASAQKSRLLEFGPDAIESSPPRRAGEGAPLRPPVEPEAGSWRPWVLASGRALRLPPPPAEPSAARERRELRKLGVGNDAALLERVKYWDFGSPGRRWNEMLAELSLRDGLGGVDESRAFALLNVAIYDALIAAWDSKYAYKRPRPSELDGWLAPEVTVPRSPSYPCEHAVTAGAAAAILAQLFPEDAERLTAAAHEAAGSRIAAGAVHPSDSEAGLALGQAVAARVIEYARSDPDGWAGRVLVGSGSSRNQGSLGTDTMGWKAHRLSEEIGRQLAEAALDENAPRAARAYALAHVAHHAALVPSPDGGFHYLTALPDRFGAAVQTFPSLPYTPSSRVATGLAPAVVLEHLFPSAPR